MLVQQLLEQSRRAPTRQPVRASTPSSRIGLDLAADQAPGQAILGDAEHHHPAEPVLGLVDR